MEPYGNDWILNLPNRMRCQENSAIALSFSTWCQELTIVVDLTLKRIELGCGSLLWFSIIESFETPHFYGFFNMFRAIIAEFSIFDHHDVLRKMSSYDNKIRRSFVQLVCAFFNRTQAC